VKFIRSSIWVAVGLDEAFARYLVGDLGDVLVREAALEMFLKCVLQSQDGNERVFGALVADDAANFFFNRWHYSHEPIITYRRASS
jgi:hypothetical protein